MKAMVLALAFTGLTANAAVEEAGCVMRNINVKTITLGLVKKGSGTATITCDGAGPAAAMTKQVSIDIMGVGIGLGTFELKGAAVSLGIHNPYDIEGRYYVTNVEAGFGIAAGATLGLKAYNGGGLSFNIGVQGGEGIGAGLTATEWVFSVVD